MSLEATIRTESVLRGDHVSQGHAQLFQSFELSRPQRDWHEPEIRLTQLQKRKLDFSGMFSAMRGGIFLQRRESLLQSRGKFGINRDLAQRRLPRALRS